MNLNKMYEIADKEYHCCVLKNCDSDCEHCIYNISEDEEKQFFIDVMALCLELEKRRRTYESPKEKWGF